MILTNTHYLPPQLLTFELRESGAGNDLVGLKRSHSNFHEVFETAISQKR